MTTRRKTLSAAHHEALLHYLAANPLATLKELSAEFNMSQAWISTLINSAAFRDRLAGLLRERGEELALSTRDRLAGIAHQAIERVSEELEKSPDPRFALDVADKMLTRLGWGRTESAGNTQVNIYSSGEVNAEILARAREKMRLRLGGESSPAPEPDSRTIEGEIEP